MVDDLSQIIDICKQTIGEFNSEQALWRGTAMLNGFYSHTCSDAIPDA